MLQFAVMKLREAWKGIESRWEAGEIKDIGVELDRKRPKGWRKTAQSKHHRDGPRVFAEISLELSDGKTRTRAVELMAGEYRTAKSQIERWYDKYK